MSLLDQLLAQHQATLDKITVTYEMLQAGEIDYTEAIADVRTAIDTQVDLQEQADELDLGLLFDSEGRWIG